MGLEAATIAWITAGVTAAGTVYSVERGQSAARQQRRSARAQAEARRVSAAQQENERQAAIRKQMREERIRRAQVMSAAEAVGVSGSSVEASTIGSGQTIGAAGQAFASGATLSNRLQSQSLQEAANRQSAAQFDLSQGQIGQAFSNIGMTAFSAFSGGGKT